MYHYTAYARFLSLPRDLPGALECYQAARRNVHARAQADLPAPLPQEKGFLRAVYAAVTAPRQFLEQAELRMILEDREAARRAVAENRVDDLIDPMIVSNLHFAALKDARDRLEQQQQQALWTADTRAVVEYAENRVRHMKIKQDLTR